MAYYKLVESGEYTLSVISTGDSRRASIMKSDKTLLLVHGASQYSRPNLIEKWVPVLELFLENEWQIVLPEMPTPNAPKAEAWLRSVAEAIDTIEGQVCLAGHSLGGSVLL